MVTAYILAKQHSTIPESELDIVFNLWVVYYDIIYYKWFAANYSSRW